MAEKLYLSICCVGLMILAHSTLVRTHVYSAGSSPIASIFEVHGISTFAHGLPGQEEAIGKENGLHHKNVQKPKSMSKGTEGTPSPEAEHPKPRTGKWCSFVHKRIVTYVDVCKTEKYVVRSQQPCPHGTPDCQKTMYRLAQKPIYELKRKFVSSLEWKCCPGYTGSTCEYADPNAIHIPLDHAVSSEKTQESPLSAEVIDMIKAVESQENLLDDIQNDIHQAASHLQDLQNALGNNATIDVGNSQNQSEIDDRVVREVVLPHVETFLKAHFSPIWTSFNKSLQNLNRMVKNLSESVENNRKTLDIFLENSVPKKDLYELGTKFESKIQENVDKLEHLKQHIDNSLHTQQTVIQHNLTMIKADTDVKLKRNQKYLQSQYSYLNFSIGELRKGQEQVQDDLLDLTQNITILHSPNDQVNETLMEHEVQIKDLLAESEAAFENINILERWIKELRTEFKQNSENVQIQFMEKSLIMEEIKDLIQRQIIELNYTVISIQNGSDELFNNCDCHKMNLDIIALEKIQRNFSNQFRDVLYGIEDVKQKEGSSKTYLQHSVEDLAQALQFNRQSLAAQQEQGRKLTLITSQLQTQMKNITDDVKLIRMDNGQIHSQINRLDNSFSTLLEDATRHERVLEALLGEEALELLSEDNPEVVYMTVIKMNEVLNRTLHILEKQLLNTDSLSERLQFLEMQHGNQNSPDPSIFNVEQHNGEKTHEGPYQSSGSMHLEPNHEASRDDDADESDYNDIMILKKDLQNLYVKVNELESSFSNIPNSRNDTIVGALKPLNISITSMKLDIENLAELYHKHMRLFQKIFVNYEALISSDAPLDIEKLKAIIDQKMKKRQKGGESQSKKEAKKHSEEHWQSDETVKPHQDPVVAFSANVITGAEAVSMIKFSDIHLDYGKVFSSEDGHFTAPYSGVYAFSISVDFGAGKGLGYLFLGAQQRIALHNGSTEPTESLKHQFAVVKLEKDEKVWFELLQGSIKKNPLGTSLSGYLIFRT